ncbi:MAG: response regulator [Gammaproteobacteria bacterium]|nr:response regulator [Gammaproteobacteria bacterium]
MDHQKNKLIYTFLESISHEVRTQLTAVLGYSELLLDNKQTEAERNNSIKTIISSSRNLQTLFNEILEVSKIQSDPLLFQGADVSEFGLQESERCAIKNDELLMHELITQKVVVNTYSNIVTGKVLLAENNIDSKELICLYAGTAGAAVDIAVSGEQAVEMALENNYDLLLININIPVMGGQEVIRALQSKKYRTPIVALTANAVLDMPDRSIEGGCSDYLTKPIDKKRFYDILRQYLQPSSAEIIPLRSSLLNHEPELHELVNKYINKYPDMIKELRMAFENTDLSLFEMLLHDIKSTGGNYGFMLITDLAIMIKTHLNNHNINAIKPLLDELELLHPRMLLAL